MMGRVKGSSKRAELLDALNQEARQSSTATVMFHAAIAERLGLNATDHKCADILFRMGPITAGELAELTGLTTGAITGVIDRHEQAGWARRVKDPHDRRRVIIQLIHDSELGRRASQLFQSLARSMNELASAYSDRDLALIVDFMARSRALLHEEAAKLRAEATSDT